MSSKEDDARRNPGISVEMRTVEQGKYPCK
jgi:hypothetical protein